LQVPKTGKGKKKAKPMNKDRFISKMFLRGDSVIIVLRNPKWYSHVQCSLVVLTEHCLMGKNVWSPWAGDPHRQKATWFFFSLVRMGTICCPSRLSSFEHCTPVNFSMTNADITVNLISWFFWADCYNEMSNVYKNLQLLVRHMIVGFLLSM
jgi:hypothetical protein